MLNGACGSPRLGMAMAVQTGEAWAESIGYHTLHVGIVQRPLDDALRSR